MSAGNIVQHSAGEWEYDESTGQVDVPDGTICVGITWRPNGYLIEAAPDLLAALQQLLTAHGEGKVAERPLNDSFWVPARTAIAKAHGSAVPA